MKKIITLSIIIIVTFLPINCVSLSGKCLEIKTEIDQNSWTPEDEGDHFPCGWEYWWLYAMLTLENGSHWDMCASFFYLMNWTGNNWSEKDGNSYNRIESWNRETGKFFDCIYETNHPGVLQHKKNIVDLKYYNSTMKGLYPNYKAHFDDDVNKIVLTIDFHAEAPPYWHFKEAVNGTIPIGVGTFRYGSIPYVEIKGNLSINGTIFNVTGVGYYEHTFGDRLVDKIVRFIPSKELIKVCHLYSSIIKWSLIGRTNNWIQKTHSPLVSIDNQRGYDWIWSVFDNGWSIIFYRLRIGKPFDFTEGPCFGVLMITDGKEFWEFNDVYIKIINDTYLEDSGLYVPLDYEIIGFKDNKSINIVFNSTTKMTKTFRNIKSFKGWLFLEAVEATGYFKEGEKTISLYGNGTTTPSLIESKKKYKSLEIELILPPNGIGISIKRISHRLGSEIFFKLQLKPFFELKFYIKKIPY